MSNIDYIFRANSGIIAEQNIDSQLSSIQMLQHIIENVQECFKGKIFFSCLCSEENLLEIPIENTKKSVRLYIAILSDNLEETKTIVMTIGNFIEDEIPWEDKLVLSTEIITSDVNSLNVPKCSYLLPIYCNMGSIPPTQGKYWYTFSEQFKLLFDNNIDFYTPNVYFFMRRLPIIVDGISKDIIQIINDAVDEKLFYVIKMINLYAYAPKLYCNKLNVKAIEKYLEEDL